MTCGDGTLTKTRSCQNVTSLTSIDDSFCPGDEASTQIENCNDELTWTVIQQRGQHGNPEDYFSSKGWSDYVLGFGEEGKYFAYSESDMHMRFVIPLSCLD